MESILVMAGIAIAIGLITTLMQISASAKQIAEPNERKKRVKGVISEMRQKLGARIIPLQERFESLSSSHSHPIVIYSLGLTMPDASNGYDAYFGFVNTGSKTIKYAKLDVVFRNAVGDEAACSIRGASGGMLEITGPIEPGHGSEGLGAKFEGAIYNITVSYVELKEVTLDYMDGSSDVLQGERLSEVMIDPGLNMPSELQRDLVILKCNGKLDLFYKQIFERITSLEFADVNVYELL